VTFAIPDFSSVRIVVAGDAMLDEYWFGEAARISPEAPVPVVRTGTAEQRAGGAANVALNVAALGARASLVAAVGADERGATLTERLEGLGVECRVVRSRSQPTIHKLRVLVRNQQLIRLDSEQSFASAAPELGKLFAGAVAGADAVVLSDYGKGTLDRASDLIGECRRRQVPVLVDPKGRDFDKYHGATALTPNQAELEAVVGHWVDETDLAARAQALRAQLDLEMLLITRGERGMTLFAKEAAPLTLAAQAREVFDVTGAGDTVIALLAVGLGAKMPRADAVALANLGAGIVVGKIGAATVTRAELNLALHKHGSGGRGLVDIDELDELVRAAKSRGERIVMTNGCFDLLHAGHVAYLEEAKSLGDHLIVAVNDDASVSRLKGRSRPVTPLADRMAVLAGLAAVDWVVPFAEDTPATLIERLLPDVLVKGGDWDPKQIAGGPAVVANGGQVIVLPYKAGRSTTGLIEALRRADS
jgi:D-beta-D-heptose 7-phosphate kinase/D-beta-D-heptose 1-phosphate adenosyltransferase